jgi:hypothetical protein
MVNWPNRPAAKQQPAHISGPIQGLYRFRCPCSYDMGIHVYTYTPDPIKVERAGGGIHVHKASWATPVQYAPGDGDELVDDTSRPVIMAIKPEYRGPDSFRGRDGGWWDRRGF